jgi:hypothetical protein
MSLTCDGYGCGPDVDRKSMLDVQTYYPFFIDRYADSIMYTRCWDIKKSEFFFRKFIVKF